MKKSLDNPQSKLKDQTWSKPSLHQDYNSTLAKVSHAKPGLNQNRTKQEQISSKPGPDQNKTGLN